MTYEKRDGYRIDTLTSGRPKWIPPHERVLDTASQMMQTFVASLCNNTIIESNIAMAARGIMVYLLNEKEAEEIMKSFDSVFKEELSHMTEQDGTAPEIRKIAYNNAWMRLLSRAMAKVNKYADGIEAQVCVVRKKTHDHNGNEITLMIPEEVKDFTTDNPEAVIEVQEVCDDV